MASEEFGVQLRELAKVQQDWESVSERLTEMSNDLGKVQSTLKKAVETDLFASPLAGIAGFGIALEVAKDVKAIESQAAALLATKKKLTDDIALDAQKIKAVIAEYEAVDRKIAEGLDKHKHSGSGGSGSGGGTVIDGSGKGATTGHTGGPTPAGGSGGSSSGGSGGSGGGVVGSGAGGGGGSLKDGGTGDWQTHTDSRGWDGWSTSGRRHPRNGEGGGVVDQPDLNGVSDVRKGIVDRALERAQHRLGYSQSSVTNGYRVDCSGLVSDAWGLPGPGLDTIGLMRSNVSHPIGKDDLQPGDAMIADEHTVIFAGWADAAHTHYIAIEDSGSQGCISHVIPYPYYPGSGPYHPYRRNGVS